MKWLVSKALINYLDSIGYDKSCSSPNSTNDGMEGSCASDITNNDQNHSNESLVPKVPNKKYMSKESSKKSRNQHTLKVVPMGLPSGSMRQVSCFHQKKKFGMVSCIKYTALSMPIT